MLFRSICSVARRYTLLPEAPPIFRVLQSGGNVSDAEMHSVFNMGVGFAAYASPELAPAVMEAARVTGYDAWLAGRVRREGGRKAVVVPSLDLVFEGDTLQVR